MLSITKIKPTLYALAIFFWLAFTGLTTVNAQSLDLFGLEVGNLWTYQRTYPGSPSTIEEEVVTLDQTTFPPTTYIVEARENGGLEAKSWYEKAVDQLKLWGGETDGDMIKFSTGLVMGWAPMEVNDHKKTLAKVEMTGYPGIILDVSMTVDVVDKELVILSFGELEAFKIRYKFRIWGYGEDETETFYHWVVPYIVWLKYQDVEYSEELTAFAIGGGTITQEADTDEDGLKDYEELIIYYTDRLDSDTDDDGLTDGDEVNIHDTDPNNQDTDGDGLTDGEEIDLGTNPLIADTDDDGLTDGDEVNTYGTDPNNEDTDSDGMPDGWEVTYGLEPTVDDADGDLDGDGMSNLDEYNNERHPNNAEPNTPALFSPTNGQLDVSLTPELETGDFSDDDVDDHALTQWQISTAPFPADSEPEPEDLVFDLNSEMQLTLLDVPPLILDANNTEYFWRVRFTDSGNATSAYAVPFSFTTVEDSPEDNDPEDGIPDGQEADCLAIFDPDAVPLDTVCFNTVVGNAQIGMEGSNNVASIEACGSVDPATIPEGLQGVELAMGLISFKAKCNQAGDIIEIIYYSSEPIPAGAKWYKYDPINGWQDYSAHIVSISADRKSITLEYQDGGFGDLDGVANGVIIDPSGPGFTIAAAGGGGGGGG